MVRSEQSLVAEPLARVRERAPVSPRDALLSFDHHAGAHVGCRAVDVRAPRTAERTPWRRPRDRVGSSARNGARPVRTVPRSTRATRRLLAEETPRAARDRASDSRGESLVVDQRGLELVRG